MSQQTSFPGSVDDFPIVSSASDLIGSFGSSIAPSYINWIASAVKALEINTGSSGTAFNVKTYGAKGDNVTNDYTSIMAAYNALVAAGGTAPTQSTIANHSDRYRLVYDGDLSIWRGNYFTNYAQ